MAIALAILVGVNPGIFGANPASSAAATTTAVAPRPALSLESFTFSSPTLGYGLFTKESPSGDSCEDFVGRTTNGGASFNQVARVASCGTQLPTSLTVDGHGDAFLYGPQLYVSHDDARTWARSPQVGSVLDVDAVGSSVWMVESVCTHKEHVYVLPCPLHLLTSTNGGRTWTPSPHLPSRAVTGELAVTGQTYLNRTGPSSAYLMLAPVNNAHGSSNVAPLWFTSNGGESWSNRQVPCAIPAWSAVLSVSSSGTLMAACGGEPSAGNQMKSVLESDNGGQSWTLKTDFGIDSGYLGAIDLVTSSEAYLVGGRSSLLVTHDGGSRWQTVEPLIGGDAGGTSQVTFFDSTHGLVLGNNDNDDENMTLWHTSDGGQHWTAELPRAPSSRSDASREG